MSAERECGVNLHGLSDGQGDHDHLNCLDYQDLGVNSRVMLHNIEWLVDLQLGFPNR